MAGQKFEKGALVRHRSGSGPDMIVVHYGKQHPGAAEEVYRCRWFSTKEVKEENFIEVELELAPSGPTIA